MVKILGVEFAPLRVPLERRIQTLCLSQWVLVFLFGGFGCLFLCIYLLFTRFYWIPLLYAVWYLLDRKTSETGGNAISWIRYNVVWRKMGEYFPAKLHKTADLDPRKSYVFGLHPHGIMHISGFLSFATEATGFSELFPGLFPHLAILHGQFQFPFYRDYLMTAGMCSVSRNSFNWMLNRPGHCACVVVGGAMEALESKPGSLNLVLMKRKGFIKQALIHGASLVPVFSFGENDVYEQVDNPDGSFLKRLQLFLTHRVFGFSLPIIRGRGIFNYTFGVFPHRRPLNTVVGAPIDVEKTDEPTQEQIDSLHERYVRGLKEMFNSNKTKFGFSEDAKLNFIG
ncbi:2-acylglycerol O-acyltransferase 2-B-like [Dreissena polymorpha]|nr:2-acylglycerol O-acyltransferase 2-B-like [Dreissena polymorpha]XP_052214760.1 2-acylglycerol O-acyltransferase 2-B-like [Dreissena polymorpha]